MELRLEKRAGVQGWYVQDGCKAGCAGMGCARPVCRAGVCKAGVCRTGVHAGLLMEILILKQRVTSDCRVS